MRFLFIVFLFISLLTPNTKAGITTSIPAEEGDFNSNIYNELHDLYDKLLAINNIDDLQKVVNKDIITPVKSLINILNDEDEKKIIKKVSIVRKKILQLEKNTSEIPDDIKELIDDLKAILFAIESSFNKLGSLDYLPPEVILIIRHFSDLSSRKNMNLVCASCHELKFYVPISQVGSFSTEVKLSQKMTPMKNHLLLAREYESLLLDIKTMQIIQKFRMMGSKIYAYSSDKMNHIIMLLTDRVKIMDLDVENGDIISTSEYDLGFEWKMLEPAYAPIYIVSGTKDIAKVDIVQKNISKYKLDQIIHEMKYCHETDTHMYLKSNDGLYVAEKNDDNLMLKRDYNVKPKLYFGDQRNFFSIQTYFFGTRTTIEINEFIYGQKFYFNIKKRGRKNTNMGGQYKLFNAFYWNKKIYLTTNKNILILDQKSKEIIKKIKVKKAILRAQKFNKDILMFHKDGFSLANIENEEIKSISLAGKFLTFPVKFHDFFCIPYMPKKDKFGIVIVDANKKEIVENINLENKIISDIVICHDHLLIHVNDNYELTVESFDISGYL